MKLTIHCEPRIQWQGPFAAKMVEGLTALGIGSVVTSSQSRLDDRPAILLGTTCWRQVEKTGRYLLVDRCSFGDTNRYVSLVLDGHGRRGNHCVPETYSFSRWCKHGVELKPWQKGSKVVLCGQTESYSPGWPSLEEWYRSACRDGTSSTEIVDAWASVTHFRPHPAGSNPTGLPEWKSWDDVHGAITLNSSVAVDALVNGVWASVWDEGGMAYNWTDRLELMRWLAWTQWHHEEIREGHPIKHLFDHLAA